MSTQAKIARSLLKTSDMYHSSMEINHNIFDMEKLEKFRVSSRYVSEGRSLKPWVSMTRLSTGDRDPLRRSGGKGSVRGSWREGEGRLQGGVGGRQEHCYCCTCQANHQQQYGSFRKAKRTGRYYSMVII